MLTGLVLKDFLVLKKYLRSMLFVLIFYAVFAFYLKQVLYLGGAMVFLTAIIPLSSFTYDDQVRWNTYALTLPLRKRDIVRGKYLFFIALFLSGALLSFLFMVGLTAVIGNPVTAELIWTAVTVCIVALCFVLFSIPLTIKFGPEKSRVATICLLMLPFFLIMYLYKSSFISKETIDGIVLWIFGLKAFLPFILAAIILALGGISYLISVRVFEKKEF